MPPEAGRVTESRLNSTSPVSSLITCSHSKIPNLSFLCDAIVSLADDSVLTSHHMTIHSCRTDLLASRFLSSC